MMETSGPAVVANIHDLEEIEQAGWPVNLPQTTYELLERAAEIHQDATALSFFLDATRHRRTNDWSYTELLEEVTRATNLFLNLGIGREGVIAYILPNLPETHFVLWGAEASGIALAINPLLDAPMIANILVTARARIVVTLAPVKDSELARRVIEAVDKADTVTDVILIDAARYAGGWRRLPAAVLGWRGRRALARPRKATLHDYRKLRSKASKDRPADGRLPTGDGISSLFCTGGTTGAPKIAIRRHANEVANAWMSSRVIAGEVKAGDTIFCGLPLFHVNAVMVTGLAAFYRGARILIGTPLGYRAPGLLDRFWEIVDHHRVASFSGVPTLYAALLQKPTASHDISSLRYAYCGAAPMPADQIRAFEAKTGVILLEGYGLTEGTCVSSVNPITGERRPGSIGLRLPFQQVCVFVLDEEGRYRRAASTGEVGAIAISGPNVFSGYQDDRHNAAIWIDRGDGQRWFNTGDLGRIDEDGYIWLTGRAKDIIIRGGHNIDPVVIEDALYAHPSVALAAAIGRPDAYSGEVPVAYVQLHPDAIATEEDLLAFAREHIGEPAARPKAVHVLQTMPLTAIGKIFKPKLRASEFARAAEAALSAERIPATVTCSHDAKSGILVWVRVDMDRSDEAKKALSVFPFQTVVEAA